MNELIMKKSLNLVAILALVLFSSVFAFSQQMEAALGSTSATIEQCLNGAASSPQSCNTASANDGYSRGNANGNKSHYVEGDSVPIRVVMTGLTVGETYTVTVGYGYTKGGMYANDYLTSYDQTESNNNNNPCVGVAGCSPDSYSSFPIPVDPEVTAGYDKTIGTADDIVQIPGSFTLFGGTITNVSGYSLDGATTGDSEKSISITFITNQSNVVLAYGSHISTRQDWGSTHSAISISGSPYHNHLVYFSGSNVGSQDLQMSADAIIYPAKLIVVKQTSVPSTGYSFPFSMSGFVNQTFSLDTDSASSTPSTYSVDVTTFTGNAITVSEGSLSGGWQLKSRSCVEDKAGGDGGSTITYGSNGNAVTVGLVEGAVVTCTYTNDLVLAGDASISGKVNNLTMKDYRNVLISLTDLTTGDVRYTRVNRNGFYRFESLEVNSSYMINVRARNIRFEPSVKVVSLNADLTDVDFTAMILNFRSKR